MMWRYVLVIVILFLSVILAWAAWAAIAELPSGLLSAWALLATLLIPPVLLLGFWMGRTEARGFLGGIDAALDKIALSLDRFDRTLERGAERRAKTPTVNVYAPGHDPARFLPPVTHRALAEDEVIDL